jgi:hypothetical protein
MDLKGLWRSSIEDKSDFSQPDYDDSSWEKMSIPANWFLGGLDHHGVVWFRRAFHHRTNENSSVLQFDGVDYFCDVYLNGDYLGHHTGYFEPFKFDVTKSLRSGKNILAVRVESPFEQVGPDGWHLRKRLIKGVLNHHDCRPGGGWDPAGQSYNTGGIWDRITLEEHGPVTIDRLLLRANMDSQPAVLHVELTVNNGSRKRQAQLEIICAPENFKGNSQASKFKRELPEGASIHSIQIPLKDIHPWQPWDRGNPYLYKITTSLIAGKEAVSHSSLFGFRSVKVEKDFHWFINGHSYFLRGSNYLPSQWLAETLFPEVANGRDHPFGGGAGGDFYTRDVALAKQANLNILRVHAHVLPPEFHEACDRAGMLVWQDFPFQWGYSDDPGLHAEARCQMQAMICRLYNHPSIVAWCCHNESPWDAPWMAGQAGGLYDPSQNRDLDAQLETTALDLDPGRYVHRNSGTGDGHTYPGWYVGHLRDYLNLPAAPFVTEYGAQGLPTKENILRMLPGLGPDAGYNELIRFKNWLETKNKVSAITNSMVKFGTTFWNITEKYHWKTIQGWMKGWGIKIERSAYKKVPSIENTPEALLHAREVWETWRFHDFQPPETFDNGIAPGASLDEFITNSQTYQSRLIQFATECYRRAKYTKVTGIIQFDLCDPWPAVTWSVLDYWRTPKPGFDALRRSMQPVLPCFRVPEIIEVGKAIHVSFCVVNDLAESFPGASCTWRLESGMGDIASASFPVYIPADGVSTDTQLTLPSLGPGKYKLLVSLTSNGDPIGDNWYELSLHQPK